MLWPRDVWNDLLVRFGDSRDSLANDRQLPDHRILAHLVANKLPFLNALSVVANLQCRAIDIEQRIFVTLFHK